MEDGFLVCSMADILQNPAGFDQKKVKVPGVFVYNADNAAIRRNWPNSSDQIGLDFSALVGELGPDVLGALKEEKIVISGIYYIDRKGPQNQYQGTIKCLGIGGY
ncbi:hypothetical protein SAMN04487998_2432 [Hymenobacter actinosclerus]|uniref:Uncharacterized protein n=2 Tax=Hymenobacter actinosclerus TaxID=82805 RepID=A0A1I0GL65_9BACT|nr:hypothetical protein SAMN04487998_2432 [Hymenobacter actinosclerus]